MIVLECALLPLSTQLNVFAFAYLMSACFDKSTTGSTFACLIFLAVFFSYYTFNSGMCFRVTMLVLYICLPVCISTVFSTVVM